MDTSDDERYMLMALDQAQMAYQQGEVPVGSIVVRDGEVIGAGWNQPISTCDATAHAEVVALRQACRHAANYRLPGSTLYVTIEPCAMCLGAMIHARVERIVFGATEPKAGALVSQLRLAEATHWNHQFQYQGGICAGQATELMQSFFAERRALAKEKKRQRQEENGGLSS